MSFTVTIVRHAQTEFNRLSLIHTYSEGSINETGLKQAKHLGIHLANKKFTRAFSSDLSRAHQTAKTVFQNSTQEVPKLVLDKRLQERSYGEFYEGKPSKELLELARKHGNTKPLTYTPPGAEAYEDALERGASFFKELCEIRDKCDAGTEEDVVIFTHGLWILLLFQYLKSKPDEYILENFEERHFYMHPPNTGTTKLVIHELRDGKRRLEFIHIQDESHLTDETLRSNVIPPRESSS